MFPFSHKEVSAEWMDGVEGRAEVGLLPAGPTPHSGVGAATSSPAACCRPPILWGNIRAFHLRMICVQHWLLGLPSDLSSFVL